MELTSIEKALKDFKQGKFLIVLDSKDRENEGDLVIAAEKIKPEHVAFMAKKASGLICVAMTRQRINQLQIPMMSYKIDPHFQTPFTVSVNARHGIGTGISAQDRAVTIKTLIDSKTTPSDISYPGHIFPLKAMDGGVRERPGHTEAAIDLATFSGMYPAGVTCEIMQDNGKMATLSDLKKFSKQYGIKIITIDQLQEYATIHHQNPLKNKKTQKQSIGTLVVKAQLPTPYGLFELYGFEETNGIQHLALCFGDWKKEPVLTRIHSQCLTGEVFGSLRCDCKEQLETAMQKIIKNKAGILLYLSQEGRGIGILHKIKTYELQDHGLDTVEANRHLGFEADLRVYSIAGAILNQLSIHSVSLMTNNPEKMKSDTVVVVKRIPLKMKTTIYNRDYLETKKNKMHHFL